MDSVRSQETAQKEHDLQAEYTARINLLLQNGAPEGYHERLQDYAIFANILRQQVPGDVMVILKEVPEIVLIGENDKYKIELYINRNMWQFKVNGSVHYSLVPEESVAPSLKLRRVWDVVIKNLPDNFIVRGKVDPRDPEPEKIARTKIHQALGFSLPQVDDCVYGIVKDKQLTPITVEEVQSLIRMPFSEIDQKLNVRSITWPGA